MARRKRKKKAQVAAKRARQQSSSPSARVEQAVDAFKAGNFEQANALAHNVLERTHNSKLTEAASQILAETSLRNAASVTDMATRLRLLDQALKHAADDPRLHYHKGVTLWRLGRAEDALVEFDTVAQYEPNRPGLGYLRQLARFATNQPADENSLTPAEVNTLRLTQSLTNGSTIDEITPLLQKPILGDDSLPFWKSLLQMRDKPKAAPPNLLQPINGNGSQPTSTVHSYYRGVAAMRKGEQQAAIDAWRAATESGYMTPWFQKNQLHALRERVVALGKEARWGQALTLVGDLPEAVRETALADKPLAEVIGTAHFHRGMAKAQNGEWAMAAHHWREATKLIGSRHLAQDLALAEEALEEWESAAKAWREMVRRRPRKQEHPDYLSDAQVATIWTRAAECYHRAEVEYEGWGGDYLYEEKLTCFKNAVKYAPDNLELRMRLVEAYLEEQREEAAENELERILEIDEDHVPALIRLGAIYDNQWGKDPVPLWQRAIELEPNNADVREALAQSYLAKVNDEFASFGYGRRTGRQHKDKIKILEEALERIPNHPALLAEIGELYRFDGKHKQAVVHLRQAWEAAPNDGEIVGRAMHELLHVKGGDKVVEAKLPDARKMTGMLAMFWIAQGKSVLDCELDEKWVTIFWDEAVRLAEARRGPDTPVFALVNIVDTAYDEEVEYLAEKYEERLRLEAPESGAIEFLEATKIMLDTEDVRKATRLLRTAQQKARKAGEIALAERAEQMSDLINGRMNPFMDILSRMEGRGGPGGGFGGGRRGGGRGGRIDPRSILADLFDELDLDEEDLDDLF